MEFVSNALCLSSHEEAYSSKNPSREHSKWLIAAAERVFIVAYRLVVLMLCELTIALKHDQYRPPLAKLLKASQISSSQWHLLWYHVKTNASPELPMLHHMVYLQNIGKQISREKIICLKNKEKLYMTFDWCHFKTILARTSTLIIYQGQMSA